jgi:HEAT repeat protein
VALRDKDLRPEAARALVKIGQVAVEPLIVALRDWDWLERRNPIDVLGEIGDARAVQPLIRALYEQFTSEGAGAALVKIGPPAVEPLIEALQYGPSWMRENVVKPLGDIGDARALAPLMTLVLNNKNIDDVVDALRKILENSASSASPEDLQAVMRLSNIEIVNPAVCSFPEFRRTVDCSLVRQLARQELIRRGLEA